MIRPAATPHDVASGPAGDRRLRVTQDRPAVMFVSLARGLGGSTRSLATILKGFEGHMVRVVAAPRTGKFAALIRDAGLAELHLPISRATRPTAWRAGRLAGAARAFLWAARHRRRLVAIHANGPEELNIAGPAALASGARVVMWCHASEGSPWTRRLAPVWRRLLRSRVGWAAVSETARGVLVESGLATAGSVTILPNPVDREEVVAKSAGPAGGRSGGDLRVGFVGSATRVKGFHLLPGVIEALAGQPIRWLLFTNEHSPEFSEQERRELWSRLRAMPRVEVVGKLEDVREVYARCDVVFCPSLRESFCRVAAEAMANGVAVVASDLPAVREVSGEGEGVLLFPAGDVEAAAERIRRLVSDPPLRAELGRSGRARAAAFDPDAIRGRLLALYGIESGQGPSRHAPGGER